MTTKEAIEVLTSANEWRRYDGDPEKQPEMPDPKQFGLAIDHAIKQLNRFEGAVEVVVHVNFDDNLAFVQDTKGYPINYWQYTLHAIPKEKQ